MRAVTRVRGRFVSTCGFRKIPCSPGSRYELIVIDGAGHPVSHVTEWYRLRQQPGAEGTRRTYLNFLLPFMSYLIKKGIAWNHEPEAIRTQIKAFLREEVACQVAPDQDMDGYRVQLSGTSPLAPSSLRVFFAALRDFYTVMAEAGLYTYDNPMRSKLLSAWKREHVKSVANHGAPEHAGIRGETWEESRQCPTAFFRQKHRYPWKPTIAREPLLVLQRMRAALTFMIEHAPTQRDRVILLLLNQTGARISEILNLTAGGYRKARQAGRAYVTNKGSLGREEKLIYFTPAIERALVHYIRTERARHDPSGHKRLEQLADHEPIFLTRRGTAYRRDSFYYHWRRWLAAVPPDEYVETLGPVTFSPHGIRHVYVSWIMRQMKQKYGQHEQTVSALRWALQQRMAWRSPLTITCYDHSESERERLEQFDAFLREVEQDAQALSHQSRSSQPGLKAPVHATVMENTQPAPSSIPQPSSHTLEMASVVQRNLSDLAFWEDGG